MAILNLQDFSFICTINSKLNKIEQEMAQLTNTWENWQIELHGDRIFMSSEPSGKSVLVDVLTAMNYSYLPNSILVNKKARADSDMQLQFPDQSVSLLLLV